MVFARFDVVRLTTIVSTIEASGDQPLSVPVAPSGARETAIASKATRKAAREQVFRGYVYLNFVIGRVDAHPV
jgi:hypothetical protein